MRPDQLLFASLFTSTFLLSPAGAAQNSGMAGNSPNAEECLSMTWGYLKSQGYEYSAINTCTYPVAVSIMTGTRKLIERTVQPGQGFHTGLTIENFEASRKKNGWIATVCRSGETPSLNASAADSWTLVLKGDYECRKP